MDLLQMWYQWCKNIFTRRDRFKSAMVDIQNILNNQMLLLPLCTQLGQFSCQGWWNMISANRLTPQMPSSGEQSPQAFWKCVSCTDGDVVINLFFFQIYCINFYLHSLVSHHLRKELLSVMKQRLGSQFLQFSRYSLLCVLYFRSATWKWCLYCYKRHIWIHPWLEKQV